MLDKLAAVEARYSQIEARLAAPETYDDPAQVARLNKEQNELSPVVETYRAYLRAREREQEAGALLSDPELRELAQEELRRARGIRQEELAEALEVSRQTIGSLENGRYNPSILLAFKIARYFGMTIEEIFLYEEEPS